MTFFFFLTFVIFFSSCFKTIHLPMEFAYFGHLSQSHAQTVSRRPPAPGSEADIIQVPRSPGPDRSLDIRQCAQRHHKTCLCDADRKID